METDAIYGNGRLDVDDIDDIDCRDDKKELEAIPCKSREKMRPPRIFPISQDFVERDGDKAGPRKAVICED